MKKIVVCCDGTGNEIGPELTNVFRISRLAREAIPPQIVFYDEGIGTAIAPTPEGEVAEKARRIIEQAKGTSIEKKVIAAYKFLMKYYEPGDQIFLFGFSRGAYAVRMLAAVIHKIGLLPRTTEHLVGKGLINFEKFSSRQKGDGDTIATPEYDLKDEAYIFGRGLSSRPVSIDFVGVWDTVESLIRPRPKNSGELSLFAFTRRNPSVRIFRHAMAIDEQRQDFPVDLWKDEQDFFAARQRFFDPFPSEPTGKQDVKQVWFAGCHADVGGGYPEKDAGLSKFSLIWMIEEATKAGLSIDQELYNRMVLAKYSKGIVYVPPTYAMPQEPMLQFPWNIRGGAPRVIPENSFIHESVFRCMDEVSAYKPKNLPKTYRYPDVDR
jgi:uncharacterized protein (DUF2235 family)